MQLREADFALIPIADLAERARVSSGAGALVQFPRLSARDFARHERLAQYRKRSFWQPSCSNLVFGIQLNAAQQLSWLEKLCHVV